MCFDVNRYPIMSMFHIGLQYCITFSGWFLILGLMHKCHSHNRKTEMDSPAGAKNVHKIDAQALQSIRAQNTAPVTVGLLSFVYCYQSSILSCTHKIATTCASRQSRFLLITAWINSSFYCQKSTSISFRTSTFRPFLLLLLILYR